MRFLALLALATATACGTQAGSGESHACTAIATRVGVGVEVAPAVATVTTSLTLTACWNGTCHDYPVPLEPGTTAAGATCIGPKPSDACLAQPRETGGKHGFAEIPDLPAAPVEVTLAGTRLTVTPVLSYPNGPGCGPGGPQTSVMVDSAGVHELR
ncbi:hypothetical protein FNH05_13755 [Amycolatopsis rhizosphaerae]|uniref:Secreted protein n=1 Tax=Amycolatopsis rhizosphaerae TaxID=2053003 RepID=A0A558CT96_9PSEU|nr:hypothetical protein [Amycolatopsis rhizosphaerae]TVT51973.1 hypothetical protein FNH05_13755 [Amycolatopsis rhizosphaerae]